MACTCVDKKWVPGTTDKMVESYVVDTDDDFAALPECYPGSKAISAASGNCMIVNASGIWVTYKDPLSASFKNAEAEVY